MQLNPSLEHLVNNPKQLFKIDLIGALLSAILLGCVLTQFTSIFGIPISTLCILASIPILFVIYDVYFLIKPNANYKLGLRRIALMNTLYCCLSIGYAFYHLSSLTIWGWWYILSEIVIVMLLVAVELSIAKNLNQSISQ